ncbi:DUF2750 domain-containing protein [Acinetobacter sp. WZC-1]|uniref:DUF2750 domain-containing protein n=1 Tax=Acinetobacter sp. WZC-1 TaxID=3459034 RepID=UPI00403DF3CB
MKNYTRLQPVSRDFILQISILKTMMYCGVLWGLYHQGWAITSDQSGHIFPFWFNSVQAYQYAQLHWPHYTPRKITPADFEESLLPTLTRFNVSPVLYNASTRKFRLSTPQMRHFFFNPPQIQAAAI